MIVSMLVLIGLAVGLIGTLVGAGGGFLVVPFLVLAMKLPPVLAAGTSLVMVTVNSLAGSFAHIRRGRVDYRVAMMLSAASYPGAVAGAWLATRLEAAQFNLMFGLLLIVLAGWMTYRMLQQNGSEAALAREPADPTPRPYHLLREIILSDGTHHLISFSIPLAVGVSFAIGTMGALLGIGGGPLIVPFMIFALGYPPHMAAATSQLIIALTSTGAATLYAAKGNLIPSYALALSAGVLVGSPLGAWLSTRIKARNLVWFMIVILLFVGLRLAI